jgi:hypothetical protein
LQKVKLNSKWQRKENFGYQYVIMI